MSSREAQEPRSASDEGSSREAPHRSASEQATDEGTNRSPLLVPITLYLAEMEKLEDVAYSFADTSAPRTVRLDGVGKGKQRLRHYCLSLDTFSTNHLFKISGWYQYYRLMFPEDAGFMDPSHWRTKISENKYNWLEGWGLRNAMALLPWLFSAMAGGGGGGAEEPHARGGDGLAPWLTGSLKMISLVCHPLSYKPSYKKFAEAGPMTLSQFNLLKDDKNVFKKNYNANTADEVYQYVIRTEAKISAIPLVGQMIAEHVTSAYATRLLPVIGKTLVNKLPPGVQKLMRKGVCCWTSALMLFDVSTTIFTVHESGATVKDDTRIYLLAKRRSNLNAVGMLNTEYNSLVFAQPLATPALDIEAALAAMQLPEEKEHYEAALGHHFAKMQSEMPQANVTTRPHLYRVLAHADDAARFARAIDPAELLKRFRHDGGARDGHYGTVELGGGMVGHCLHTAWETPMIGQLGMLVLPWLRDSLNSALQKWAKLPTLDAVGVAMAHRVRRMWTRRRRASSAAAASASATQKKEALSTRHAWYSALTLVPLDDARFTDEPSGEPARGHLYLLAKVMSAKGGAAGVDLPSDDSMVRAGADGHLLKDVRLVRVKRRQGREKRGRLDEKVPKFHALRNYEEFLKDAGAGEAEKKRHFQSSLLDHINQYNNHSGNNYRIEQVAPASGNGDTAAGGVPHNRVNLYARRGRRRSSVLRA